MAGSNGIPQIFLLGDITVNNSIVHPSHNGTTTIVNNYYNDNKSRENNEYRRYNEFNRNDYRTSSQSNNNYSSNSRSGRSRRSKTRSRSNSRSNMSSRRNSRSPGSRRTEPLRSICISSQCEDTVIGSFGDQSSLSLISNRAREIRSFGALFSPESGIGGTSNTISSESSSFSNCRPDIERDDETTASINEVVINEEILELEREKHQTEHLENQQTKEKTPSHEDLEGNSNNISRFSHHNELNSETRVTQRPGEIRNRNNISNTCSPRSISNISEPFSEQSWDSALLKLKLEPASSDFEDVSDQEPQEHQFQQQNSEAARMQQNQLAEKEMSNSEDEDNYLSSEEYLMKEKHRIQKFIQTNLVDNPHGKKGVCKICNSKIQTRSFASHARYCGRGVLKCPKCRKHFPATVGGCRSRTHHYKKCSCTKSVFTK